MKFALQYLNNAKGEVQAIQLPISEWEKVLTKLKKYEQALKLKSDIKDALDQVKMIQSGKGKRQTLNEFINEL